LKHVQIKLESGQLREMATAFGVRRFGAALVVICGFYRLSGRETRVGFLFDHCQNIEVDYQSGPEQRRSKGSADLIYARASIYWSIPVP